VGQHAGRKKNDGRAEELGCTPIHFSNFSLMAAPAALAATRAGAGRAAAGPARRLTRRASSAAASAAAAGGQPSLFSAGRVALLERPPARVGAPTAAAATTTPRRPPLPDDRLWRTGAFAAQVHPDLPAAASVTGWARSLLARGAGGDPPLDAGTGGDAGDTARPASSTPWVVRTVAAQTRSLETLEARLLAAAAGTPGVSPPADALLLVSGGDPARRLGLPAWAGGARTDAVAMLRAAKRMQGGGGLPSRLALWCVANPLTEGGAGRAAEKVDAGAAALLTQPPLGCWAAWEGWYADADRRGVTRAAAVVAGLALPTTAAGFAFWVGLAGAGGVEGVAGGLGALGSAAAAGQGSEFALQTARAELDRLAGMPGIAGVHVMPVSQGGRGVAERLVEDGALNQWGRWASQMTKI